MLENTVVSKMFVEYQFSTKGDVRNINETTLFLYIGITQVYLDFTFHLLKKRRIEEKGGGILLIKVIDFILCNGFCQTWIL